MPRVSRREQRYCSQARTERSPRYPCALIYSPDEPCELTVPPCRLPGTPMSLQQMGELSSKGQSSLLADFSSLFLSHGLSAVVSSAPPMGGEVPYTERRQCDRAVFNYYHYRDMGPRGSGDLP